MISLKLSFYKHDFHVHIEILRKINHYFNKYATLNCHVVNLILNLLCRCKCKIYNITTVVML